MIKIEDFAFCFFASDPERVSEQEKELTKISPKYQIERWYRHDRNPGKYTSFSQMVNDAIDDTDSEFMIFCNPKTNFTSDDVETIIDRLSNGYCFASVVNFGFFGFSKELIRRIGMMDENFIDGEYEDFDFIIRLNHFGKAIYWAHDENKYGTKKSKYTNMRHVSYAFFHEKYHFFNGKVYIDKNMFKHKNISKRHSKTKSLIFNSWFDKEETICNNFRDFCDFTEKPTILTTAFSEELNLNFKFSLTRDQENFKVELNSSQDRLRIYFSLISSIEDGGVLQMTGHIENNMWRTFKISNNKKLELRLVIGSKQIFVTLLDPIDNLGIDLKVPAALKKWQHD
jgi:hypothetical protein